MCIWIDKNAYSDHCDDQKMFEYLYHLCRMLARKRDFFERSDEFDDFAMYAATETFMRYRDKRQFTGDEGSRLSKIKSVLNYLHKVIYPRKVAYAKTQEKQRRLASDVDYMGISYDLHNKIQEAVAENSAAEFDCAVHDIPSTIRRYMIKLPMSRYSAEWENIYISCLLSFLNYITLSNANRKRNEPGNGRCVDSKIYNSFRDERLTPCILYHLDENMRPYVGTITRIIMHLVAKDISEVIDSNIYAEDHKNALLLDSLGLLNEDGDK